MELVEYINIIKKNAIAIIVSTIVFASLTLMMTYRQPMTYQSSATVEVSLHQVQDQSSVNYFQYDNYYNTKVAQAFSDNLVGLVSSPSIVADTFKAAGYPLPQPSLRDLGKTFTAKKSVDQSSVVVISYSTTDSAKAQKMVATLTQILRDNVIKNNLNDNSVKLEVNFTDTIVLATPKSYALNAVIAGFIGLFLSLSYGFLAHAVKK